MAFIVKPVNGEPRVMELATIREALKNGVIADNWLVRDERQDFWYSVGKLVGKIGSQPITMFCPQCRTPIAARRIDIGLPAACGKCGTQVVVPDPDEIERRQRDERRLGELRQRTVFSGVVFAAGAVVTVLTFIFSTSQGFWILWWGPLAFGGGTFVACLPEYLGLRRRLRTPKAGRASRE